MAYKIPHDVANETNFYDYKAMTDFYLPQEIEYHYSNPVMDNTDVIIGIEVKENTLTNAVLKAMPPY